MTIKLSEFTDSAQLTFEEFIDNIKSGSIENPPYDLLQGEENVLIQELSNGEVELDQNTNIETREDIGRYLSSMIETEEDIAEILDSKKIGSFLCLLFFDSICKRNEDNTWKITQKTKGKDTSRYIPNLNHRQRFYRHLILGPLAMFSLHGDLARLYLCQEAYIHPETMEQIASREESVLNNSIIELLDRLYWDDVNEEVKNTVTSYDPVPNGAMRRFVGPGSFTEQYGVVYDFWNMSADEISKLLPRPEFDAWLE